MGSLLVAGFRQHCRSSMVSQTGYYSNKHINMLEVSIARISIGRQSCQYKYHSSLISDLGPSRRCNGVGSLHAQAPRMSVLDRPAHNLVDGEVLKSSWIP